MAAKYHEIKSERLDIGKLKDDLRKELEYMAPQAPTNGWTKYEKFVLHELEQQSCQQEKIMKSIGELSQRVAVLSTKIALYGVIAGTVSAAIVSAVIRSVMQ